MPQTEKGNPQSEKKFKKYFLPPVSGTHTHFYIPLSLVFVTYRLFIFFTHRVTFLSLKH